MTGSDYTRSELDALEELAKPSPLDDWHSWSSSAPAGDDLWDNDPELAYEVDVLHRRYQRLNSACKMLHLRGLVEREAFPSLGRGWFYRLIPMLRAEQVEPDSGRSELPT